MVGVELDAERDNACSAFSVAICSSGWMYARLGGRPESMGRGRRAWVSGECVCRVR